MNPLLFVACFLLGWVGTDVVLGRMNPATPYVLMVGLLVLAGGLTMRALDGDKAGRYFRSMPADEPPGFRRK